MQHNRRAKKNVPNENGINANGSKRVTQYVTIFMLLSLLT